MRKFLWFIMIVFLPIVSCSTKDTNPSENPPGTPPFDGTIFLDPDILTEGDYSTFEELTNKGQNTREMFDRRANDWITTTPFLFQSNYDDGLTIEIQVNPEFENTETAEIEALKYAVIIGRLPTALRAKVETVWIHKGTKPFGGGNNNLLIHTGQATLYENDGIIEETFVHEASHTSLDEIHATSAEWISAQKLDNNFISTYARDNPTREDIAESFLLYMAIRYREHKISPSLKNKTLETIENRIHYFDNQNFNMYPIE